MQFSTIQKTTTPILLSFGVKKAALFGSTARNENMRNSDIDLLVQLGKKISLFEFIDMKLKLQEALHVKVDVIQYDKIKPSLKSFILQDEKVFLNIWRKLPYPI